MSDNEADRNQLIPFYEIDINGDLRTTASLFNSHITPLPRCRFRFTATGPLACRLRSSVTVVAVRAAVPLPRPRPLRGPRFGLAATEVFVTFGESRSCVRPTRMHHCLSVPWPALVKGMLSVHGQPSDEDTIPTRSAARHQCANAICVRATVPPEAIRPRGRRERTRFVTSRCQGACRQGLVRGRLPCVP